MRTHGAGTLRASDAGTTVTLAGWVARRRDHGGVAFLDLRDSTGIAQVVVRDELLASSDAHDLRNEYCVTVSGEVSARPEGNANPDLPSGEIEVVATRLAMRSPVTHSARSHQCDPMSPNARDGPPSAGSTRQLVAVGDSSQSCR